MSSRAVRFVGPVLAVLAMYPVDDRGAAVLAKSRSATMTVGITVIANCTISTSAVTFGSFDPVVANATAPLDASGAVIVACTKGAVTTIDLGAGQNPAATVRRMWGGAEYLGYELYKDAGRTQSWGSGMQAMSLPAAPSMAPRSLTVYGRIPGAQDVRAASYSDTVTVTVNF